MYKYTSELRADELGNGYIDIAIRVDELVTRVLNPIIGLGLK
jgi:hypothetical protein